ncbi:marvel domain-containing protein [Xylaria bambusicola]|uniref:marvel domain-containing protein n=1 Tax=Xylaria bambusicola TaxID=326684 RepID=UPI00200733A9|nr:marvel domain-containing protein [Xylaria bambusicola]KAI0526390.1 marvel domain-containing protein [Xylaria bambusicola]
MLNIAAIALRGFLVIFGAVVLGLSVTLAKQQVIGSPPAETSFYSFAGAFGLVASAIAILAMIIDKVPRVGVIVADGLASLFYLAGAIALTVALKPVSSCTSSSARPRSERFANKLLNGGCNKIDNQLYCPNAGSGGGNKVDSYTSGRCQEVQADYVFGYLAAVFGLASIIVTFLTQRRTPSTGTYV